MVAVMDAAHELEAWVLDAIRAHGGKATLVQIARHVWEAHADQIQASDDLLNTWQILIRRAGQTLEQAGKLKKERSGRFARWLLA